MHALRRCRRFRRNTALRSFSCRSVTCTWIRSACVRCTALFRPDLKIRFIEDELSPVEMIAMLSHARCFIGTSLHGSAVSSAYGVPAVALNFANLAKVRGAFRLLGAEDCLAADFADLPAAMDAALKRSASAAAELRRQAEEHMDRLIGCIGAPKRHAFTQRGAQSFFLEVHHMLTKGVTQRRGILYYARPSSDFQRAPDRISRGIKASRLCANSYLMHRWLPSGWILSKGADASCGTYTS